MRQMSVKASKSFSHAGHKRTVNVRVSNGKTVITSKSSAKKK